MKRYCAISFDGVDVRANGPGSAITIVVGGAEESLHSRPGVMELVLKKRHGFIRIAIETGSLLVPILSFGENGILCNFQADGRFIPASSEIAHFKTLQIPRRDKETYRIHNSRSLGERSLQLRFWTYAMAA